jgi:small-conductance mechanosensitive channel
MPSKEDGPSGEWSAKLVRLIIYLVSFFTILGIVLAYLTTELALVLAGFRMGVIVSILYLIYKIAQEVHYFRTTH